MTSDEISGLVQNVAGSLLGGVLAVATGYWLFWIQRRTSAKDDFHATIDDLRAKLARSRNKTDIFYNESLEVLRLAIIKVRRHLQHEPRTRLQKTFQDYESEKRWFESPERVMCLMVDLDSKGHPHPQKFLDDFLDKFDGCL